VGKALAQLEDAERLVVGDCLLAAAFLAYAGPFPPAERARLLTELWLPDISARGIPVGARAAPMRMLSGEALTSQWHTEGLPADACSEENATVVTMSERFPLMIDPQQQAVSWLAAHEKASGVIRMSMGADSWPEMLMRAIEDGLPIILENVGEVLDTRVFAVLFRAYVPRAGKLYISIGDRMVEVHCQSTADGSAAPAADANDQGEATHMSTSTPLFRVFFQTRLSTPHFGAELQGLVALVDFTVTEAGLEDQLLRLFVQQERPKLLQQQSAVWKDKGCMSAELSRLEDRLLSLVASAKGELVANEDLIETLGKTQEVVAAIEADAATSERTQRELDESLEVYRPAARRAVLVFSVVKSLAAVDNMYQYSLAWLKSGYQRAVQQNMEGGGGDAEERVVRLQEMITLWAHKSVSRGVFKRHCLLFPTNLAIRVAQSDTSLAAEKRLRSEELSVLLAGPFTAEVTDNRARAWLPDAAWAACCGLAQTLAAFATLPGSLQDCAEQWSAWVRDESPEEKPLPRGWEALTLFQKVLLVKILCPHRTPAALIRWSSAVLGGLLVEPAAHDVADSFAYSSPDVPIFFLLSPGADPPTLDVLSLGRAHSKTEANGKLSVISMGQGQEPEAERALDGMAAKGGWVVLQNLDVVPEWLPKLMAVLESSWHNAHPEFRVFLTSKPSKYVPVDVLQASIKLTNEPPHGLKHNVLRALQAARGAMAVEGPQQLKTVVFALCVFHAMVCERRKFGARGWNQSDLQFNQSDLQSSVAVARRLLSAPNGSDTIPWASLRFLIGEVFYGGHISGCWDYRLCKTLLERFVHDGIFSGTELLPGLAAPPADGTDDQLERMSDALAAQEWPSDSRYGDAPSVFGLPRNTALKHEKREAHELCSDLFTINLLGGPSEPHVQLRDAAFTSRLSAQVAQILEMLPPPFAPETLERLTSGRDALASIFRLEAGHISALLEVLTESLTGLADGLNGVAPLTVGSKAEGLIAPLETNQVPALWKQHAWPSLRPLGSWLIDLQARHAQLQSWVDGGCGRLPAVWISGLVNPQGLLTAVLQEASQRTQVALEELVVVADVTDLSAADVSAAAADGVYVHGLYLEGAQWDVVAGVLDDSQDELYCPLPVALLRGVPKASVSTSEYECPIFKTVERAANGFVASVGLRTAQPQSKWIMAGAALLMDVE